MASILVICTGNVCRSPLAEGFLRSALEQRFGDAAPEVASAGTMGWEGSGAMAESIAAARELDVDISTHHARLLLREHVADADLVIGMAREHVDAVRRALPAAAGKTFTLKELVRLLEALPPADPAGGPEALTERVAEAEVLRRSGFEGNPQDEDVVDPLGMALETYRSIAWELRDYDDRLVDALFGARAGAGSIREDAS
ncbi:MAG: protein-tyrosine-phosphatase [Actinomycetota bacterium]